MLRFVALLCVLAAGAPAWGDVSLQAEVDRDQIDLNGQITLTVTVTGAGDDVGEPELPPLPDFATVGTGSTQNLVIAGGQMSRSTSYAYTLMPRKTGRLVIGPVTLAVPGGQLKTDPIAVTVTQAGYAAPRRNSDPQGGTTRRAAAEPFFVEAEVSDDTLYLGEQLTYTFSYFRDISLTESNSFTPPATTGFISVELPPQRKRTSIIDGRTYSVVQVVKAMFPTRTGPLSIGPARLRVVPDMLSNLLGRDPFDVLRGRRSGLTAGEPRDLATRAFEIYVKPLPPVPPGKNFSGAVGSCQIGCQSSADSVGLGDPVTVTWTVTGRGRKDVIDAPVVVWPDGLETFPPATELETSTRNDIVAETKVFSIAVVPRREGTVTIPAPELTYFNPETGRYETARGRELLLAVGPPRAGMTIVAPTQTISAAASTIRYLKPSPESWDTRGSRVSAFLFIAGQALPPLLVLAVYGWKRRSESPEQRARGARQREVRKARRRIASLRGRDPGEVTEELAGAFRHYLMARFGLSAGDFLDRQWTARLAERGCTEADVRQVAEIIDWTLRARFGGGAQGGQTAERVLDLLTRLDKCAY